VGLLARYAGYLWDRASKASWKTMYSMLEEARNGVLLDLGCGDGGSTMKVASYVKVEKIIGIDMDDDTVKKASSKGITVYKSDLNRRFPIEDDSVDIVFANQVIEHLINIDNFISEIYRCLRPNGYVLICTENLASWHNIFALILGEQPSSGPFVSTKFVVGLQPLHPICENPLSKRGSYESAYMKHNTVLSYKALRKVFELYGFESIRIIGSGYHPSPSPVSELFTRVDPCHAHFLTLKGRKPKTEVM